MQALLSFKDKNCMRGKDYYQKKQIAKGYGDEAAGLVARGRSNNNAQPPPKKQKGAAESLVETLVRVRNTAAERSTTRGHRREASATYTR